MVKVKICGIKKLEDAQFAAKCGADFIGFIFFKDSPRYIEPEEAFDIISNLPEGIKTVGVFVNQTREEIKNIVRSCKLSYVQLHGDETPEFINELEFPTIKAIRLKEEKDLEDLRKFDVFAYVFDSRDEHLYGGTGKTFDLSILENKKIERPFFMSGGLNPENVAGIISRLKPYGVDVSSGVETSPGVKDHQKIIAFIKAVKG